ncbi:MAG: hypothetical protein J6Q84_07405 [Kiritimatiellae bacterium]|nr:hypothetical protein [Kiritimatiellia bacterium]
MALTHDCIVTDKDDHHFIIETNKRVINNSAIDLNDYYSRPVMVRGDKNSERFTFEVPLIVEGHDMSECNKIEIHYINKSPDGELKSSDVYEVTDKDVVDENGAKVTDKSAVDDLEKLKLRFTWLIPGNATKYVGTLSFAVKFLCINDAIQPPASNIEYAWNTKPVTGANVEEGYDNWV